MKVSSSDAMLHFIFTLDVERNWSPGIYPEKPDYSTIRKVVPEILEQFKDSKIRGTFFITGEVAKNNESLVRTIAKGHEIAVHTHPYEHKNFPPHEREKDLLAN